MNGSRDKRDIDVSNFASIAPLGQLHEAPATHDGHRNSNQSTASLEHVEETPTTMITSQCKSKTSIASNEHTDETSAVLDDTRNSKKKNAEAHINIGVLFGKALEEHESLISFFQSKLEEAQKRTDHLRQKFADMCKARPELVITESSGQRLRFSDGTFGNDELANSSSPILLGAATERTSWGDDGQLIFALNSSNSEPRNSIEESTLVAAMHVVSNKSAFSEKHGSMESLDSELNNESNAINSMPAPKCTCGLMFREVDHFCRGCGATRHVVVDKCYNCRKKMPDDAHFCTTCGKARQAGHEIATVASDDATREEELILHLWLKDGDMAANSAAKEMGSAPLHSQLSKATSNVSEIYSERSSLSRELSKTLCGRLVHSPEQPGRIAFDILGALLISYDAIMHPLQVFDISESVFSRFVQSFSFYYWNVNMAVSFFTSYSVKDRTGPKSVKGVRLTAKHYIKTWFAFDLLVMLPDWISLFAADVDEPEDAGFAAKFVRIVRLLRMLRLLRIVKLLTVTSRVGDVIKINSELMSILVSILKSVVTLLAVSHVIACAWYLCATSQEGDRETWADSQDFENHTWLYVYGTALHWSLTQFTPASMDVQPKNLLERTFAVIVVVLAMTTFSYILGNVSAAMGRLRNLQEDHSKNFWQVRRFMRHHDVPMILALRIQNYLEAKFLATHRKVHFADVPLFKLLSQQLTNELNVAQFLKHLCYQPLIEFRQDQVVFMGKLVQLAVAEQHLAADDCLFLQSEASLHMYIVAEGGLEYSQMRGAVEIVSDNILAGEKILIAEATLWVHSWVYLGCCVTTLDTVLIAVNAPRFSEVAQKYAGCTNLIRRYATLFISILKASDFKTDVHEPDHYKIIRELFANERKAAFQGTAAGMRKGATTRIGSILNFFRLSTF